MNPTLREFFIITLIVAFGCTGCSTSSALRERQYDYKTIGERALTLDVDYPPNWKTSDKRISPSYHIRKEAPPTLIIDGTADTPNAQIRDFVERSKSVGAPVEVCYTEGQPHAFFNNSPWLEKATEEADEFLCRIGYLKKEPRVPLPSRDAKP